MAQFTLNDVQLDVPDAMLTPKIRQRMRNGMYEAPEARSVLLSVEHGDRVLELGAGIGYISALAGMIAGPENVISVEANPDLLDVIAANHLRNDCAAIDLRHGAVAGDATPEARIDFTQSAAFWASSVGGAAGPKATVIEVPVLPFWALIAEQEPSVVIMDIEGAEADLFDRVWPEHVRVLLMEIHPRRYPDYVVKQIFDQLSASGLVYSADLSRGKTLGFLRLGVEI